MCSTQERGLIAPGSMKHLSVVNDERPCRECGSPRHGSHGHQRLTWAQNRWEPWAIGWEQLVGMPGAHSPGDRILAPPDLALIVPSIISGGGFHDCPVATPAILRLWNPDPSAGLTYMLSFDSHAFTMREQDALERACGGLGSNGTVAVRFANMRPNEELGSIW